MARTNDERLNESASIALDKALIAPYVFIAKVITAPIWVPFYAINKIVKSVKTAKNDREESRKQQMKKSEDDEWERRNRQESTSSYESRLANLENKIECENVKRETTGLNQSEIPTVKQFAEEESTSYESRLANLGSKGKEYEANIKKQNISFEADISTRNSMLEMEDRPSLNEFEITALQRKSYPGTLTFEDLLAKEKNNAIDIEVMNQNRKEIGKPELNQSEILTVKQNRLSGEEKRGVEPLVGRQADKLIEELWTARNLPVPDTDKNRHAMTLGIGI